MMKPVFSSRGVVVGVLVALLVLIGSAELEAAHPEAVRGTGGAVASAALSRHRRVRDSRCGRQRGRRRGGHGAGPGSGPAAGGQSRRRRVRGHSRQGQGRKPRFSRDRSGGRHANMYLDESGGPESEASLIGPLAAGVPGSPVGLYELHQS